MGRGGRQPDGNAPADARSKFNAHSVDDEANWQQSAAYSGSRTITARMSWQRYRVPSTKLVIRALAMACLPGTVKPSGCRRSSIALASSRENQRASAISLLSTVISVVSALPVQPSIKECGKGHGWLE